MAGNPEPLNSVFALIGDIVRNHNRTRHAVLLVLSIGFATALNLTALLIVVAVFGSQGATAVIGILATAGLAARRTLRRRTGPVK